MAYLVSARKWRPQTFDEIIGQQAIVKAIKNEIEQGKVAHAYLFTGPRGIGKTSSARILAKSLNCEKNGPSDTPCNTCENCREITNASSIDVLEIDGASNNGVQQVREVIDAVRYMPTKSNYKIYIIDEFHMLSVAAFNALLKTLEEPPAHAVFIAATTEPHKILPTIKSRMKVFNFTPLALHDITDQLKKVIEHNSVNYEEEALFLIAKYAEGSLRDALSILDVVLSIVEKQITPELVLGTLGVPKEDAFFSFLDSLKKKDVPELINIVHQACSRGENLSQFAYSLLEYFRHLLVMKKIPDAGIELIPLGKKSREKLAGYLDSFTLKQLLEILNILIDLNTDLKSAVNERFVFEQYIVKISRYETFIDMSYVLEKINYYENKYSKYGSIIQTGNTDEKKPEQEKDTGFKELSEDYFEVFLDNIDDEHKRLVSALDKNIHASGVKQVKNGVLELTCEKYWQYEDLTQNNNYLAGVAEKEFERIFGVKVNVKVNLDEGATKGLKDKRKNNIKMVNELFGNNKENI